MFFQKYQCFGITKESGHSPTLVYYRVMALAPRSLGHPSLDIYSNCGILGVSVEQQEVLLVSSVGNESDLQNDFN